MKTSLPGSSSVIGQKRVWAGTKWRQKIEESKITRPAVHTCSLSSRLPLPWRPLMVCSQWSCWLNQEQNDHRAAHWEDGEDPAERAGWSLPGRLWGPYWESWEVLCGLHLWRFDPQMLESSGMLVDDAETPNQTRECWGHFLHSENTWTHQTKALAEW